MDCAGINWLLVDQQSLPLTSLYLKQCHWINIVSPDFHWNGGLRGYKLVVSWPDNPRQLVEARGWEKNSHQWCNSLSAPDCLTWSNLAILTYHCLLPPLWKSAIFWRQLSDQKMNRGGSANNPGWKEAKVWLEAPIIPDLPGCCHQECPGWSISPLHHNLVIQMFLLEPVINIVPEHFDYCQEGLVAGER